MTKMLRCPYCAWGQDFRPMIAHVDGTFICNKCGHTSRPEDAAYKCRCYKCSEMDGVRAGRRDALRKQANG